MRDLSSRERAALDRYITGNWGEDQFSDFDEDRFARVLAARGYLNNILDTLEEGGGTDGWAIEIADQVGSGDFSAVETYVRDNWENYR